MVVFDLVFLFMGSYREVEGFIVGGVVWIVVIGGVFIVFGWGGRGVGGGGDGRGGGGMVEVLCLGVLIFKFWSFVWLKLCMVIWWILIFRFIMIVIDILRKIVIIMVYDSIF